MLEETVVYKRRDGCIVLDVEAGAAETDVMRCSVCGGLFEIIGRDHQSVDIPAAGEEWAVLRMGDECPVCGLGHRA